MAFLDTIILIGIIGIGLFLFYNALKEPLDQLFALIGRGIGALRDRVQDRGGNTVEVIRYG